MMTMNLGFIGLGNMGGRIARRLRLAGFTIRGFDLRADLAQQLELIPACSVAEVCDVSLLLLSLPDSPTVEGLMHEPDGILAHAKPGLTVVDLTSGEPAVSRKLHALLAEQGVDYLDAGVSGGTARAETGTLSIMVGGSADALLRVQAILDVIGNCTHHMGAPGNGHATKALNNFLNGVNLAATAEAMVVGVTAGLDPALLLKVINESSGQNWASLNRFPRIIAGDYLEGGLTCALQAKDLDIYNNLARRLMIPTLLGDTCRSVFTVAIAMGYGSVISNRVVDALGDLGGGVRVQRRANPIEE